jgi:hypothetical protein
LDKHIDLDHGGGNKLNLGNWLIPTRVPEAWNAGCEESELLESLGVNVIATSRNTWTGTRFVVGIQKREGHVRVPIRNTKKVALIILERGWRINGGYISKGFST